MGKQSKSKTTKETPTKDDDEDGNSVVPMEISDEEYQELLYQAKDLTLEEAREEWMESCRYGEVDVVRALAENFPSSREKLVEFVHPDTGNTGLHMASANGHTNVVKLLVRQYGHSFTKNSSGNTPLHWAAANGQASVVKFWTSQTIVEVDVLEKNSYGRSALTEGFSSENQDVVAAILEHDSASEEKLLSTGGGQKGNGGDGEGELLDSHIHSFFDKEQPLKIRELAMKNADNPFADTERPDQDTTGLSIWSASLVMARWMQAVGKTGYWKDSSVLELGSGCGVPGLMVATSDSSRPRQIYLTDLNPQTVENLQYNVELNNVQDFVEASCMDWDDKATWPEEKVDFVIGSDLIYIKTLVPLLTSVIFGTIKPGGKFLYVCPDTGRDGLDAFVEAMKNKCPGWVEQVAPKQYHANPLTNEDDEECFLHFQELSSLTYMLYEFPIPNENS
uniref:Calmodulin-lysine N-methyltransferase n=1 Tax=Pseudo-nitzschia australis TaxID=44445 RepID=A0A7S4ER75_9STRA|mmetsp:Transcript_9687/g.20971  ORF Transcript_9687/g.20971 Transcript_9687/m.20971 type:complete len:449 (-) Transcript_9687:57-1403(-)